MVDKNQAVIDFLLQCPQIRDSPLYFNFINAEDNNKQFLTTANDANVNRPYIDGSVLKRYTFTIIDYKSVADIAIAKLGGLPNENVEEMLDTQAIIDWVHTQNDLRNFPDFGEDCVIDEIVVTTDRPDLTGIDTKVTPALAVYSITVRIEYIDNSKKLWR